MADLSEQMTQKKTTHFGFEEVDYEEKAHRVRAVFSSVANKYDLMNDVMSLGLHRVWKRFAVSRSGVKKGQRVLDLAGGTGDLTNLFQPLVGEQGLVILADINREMLNRGRQTMVNRGRLKGIEYIQLDAESLPFANNYFDCVAIGFGLRNVTDKETALSSMYQVLKPGGRVLILEFSHPIAPAIEPLYDFYSMKILPLLGDIIANDSNSYRYLAESIRKHPDQHTLLEMMKKTGFEKCEYYNLSGGIVALHQGYKL